MKKEINRIRLLFLFYPVFALLLSFLIEAGFFVSTLIFLGVPSLILSFKNKNLIKKCAFFSAAFGIPLTIIIDYLHTATRTWFIPKPVFTFRLFGVNTIDMVLWGFFYAYLVVMYYEYVHNHDFKGTLNLNRKSLIIFWFASLFIFLTLLVFKNKLMNIGYVYLSIGLMLGILPIATVLLKFPSLFVNFFKTGIYFFYFNFIYEITALKLGQWTFPGTKYIGFVNIFGIRFPFEELFFWITLGAVSILALYKLFFMVVKK